MFIVRMRKSSNSVRNPPYAMVVALLAETGSDRGALFLDDGSLVCNRLGRTHVADELFYCRYQTSVIRTTST